MPKNVYEYWLENHREGGRGLGRWRVELWLLTENGYPKGAKGAAGWTTGREDTRTMCVCVLIYPQNSN
jgi:hypothetical protein